MLKIKNLNKGIFAGLALLMLVGMVPMTADAQASTCRVRADVTSGEAWSISGGAVGSRDGSGTLYAAGTAPGGTNNLRHATNSGAYALICGFALIKWVANVIFAVLIAIAVLMIAYAAFLFVTAGDKPQNQLKAKKVMLWAIIGLIVASIAKLVPQMTSTILGFTS